ncbi:MAG: hypothetical protein OEL56_07365 [Nitrosopumilus sp.]|nr:hypothetical protein [Nitrosopumilus sp.]MDH3516991.1 hypothetical protein [Nitrosopumilus sp.]MDH3565689.1 hypothetical protein [Nitrosopumilus sp.]MDH5416547.1 hypothetical protein [Nitrosopumilus sp.]MDH5555147.1 hypothetical protein [Nitrosopumilus sp.]
MAKNGVKIDTPDFYNDAFKKFYNSVSSSYSNQARIAETALNVMEQNLKLLNGNMGVFTDLMSSFYSWWTLTKN